MAERIMIADDIYIPRDDEWTDDAENEPNVEDFYDPDSTICCDEPTDEELAEWARVLMEGEDENETQRTESDVPSL